VITAGRRVNDYMPEFVALETVKGLIQAGVTVQKAKVLILGLAFKENVSDLRNSKIVTTIKKLQELGITVEAFDPLADPAQAEHEFGLRTLPKLEGSFDAVILATNHAVFNDIQEKVMKLLGKTAVVFDVKNAWGELRSRPGTIYLSL
jgi:UDP-N-acetyl-D-galactosamine dehydrogenase